MTHFGILAPTSTGHLNPMTALGFALRQRGHGVTLIGPMDAEDFAKTADLGFRPIARDEFPKGQMDVALSKLGRLSEMAAARQTVDLFCAAAAASFAETPAVIRQCGIEAMVVDQVSSTGGTISEYLGIPYVHVACALMMNRELGVPPMLTSWDYQPGRRARLRNGIGYWMIDRIGAPLLNRVNEQRKDWDLPPYADPNDAFSPLAQVSQQVAEFEFPRAELPACFHYVGPLYKACTREPVEFPYERLNGQPLIYASMGSIHHHNIRVFELIAEACRDLDAQLVISLGRRSRRGDIPRLPGNPLVLSYAPQTDLLSRASLVITHGGVNTAMETLSHGVPMVVIPIANDQPGVAARIRWTGAGEFVGLKGLTAPALRQNVEKIYGDDPYRRNAQRLQTAIEQSGGADRAAAIIEAAIIS